jgi:Pterin 4 alpha carbinolamine dehydratase
MPHAEALPEEIQELGYIQPFELRNDSWKTDLRGLVRELEGQGFKRMNCERSALSHTTGQHHGDSAARDGHDPALCKDGTRLPRFYRGGSRCSRSNCAGRSSSTRFPRPSSSFARSVNRLVKVQHHPHWENIWRPVTIGLSTSDIGHKPSQLDVDLAREIERVHKQYVGKLKTPRKSGHSRAP